MPDCLAPSAAGLLPPPPEVRQRAWQCAFRLGSEHFNTIGCLGRLHWPLDVLNPDPARLTWRERGAWLRLYALVAQPERAAGAWVSR
jgi:hypothetical protein